MRLLYKTPIVFCTGYGDLETLQRIHAFGGAECLIKPIMPAELRDAILRACALLAVVFKTAPGLQTLRP